MNMEWDDLKHFLAVARSGSLTEAARSLKTSAATVGRRVAELEDRLGARLFERSQAGYTLSRTARVRAVMDFLAGLGPTLGRAPQWAQRKAELVG
jgi:DNA-binding transcriptional LysR family regulator